MKKNLILIFATVFVALILFLTIRGIRGNPLPNEILINLRSETKPFEISPERGRYALLTSIVDHNSLSFSLDIAKYVVPDLGYSNGKFVSLFAPGVSYSAIPLYLIGEFFNLGQLYAFATISVFALLNVVLIILIVKKLTNNIFIGVVSGLTFLFATSAWPYAITLYQHHETTFLLLLALTVLLNKPNKFTSIIFPAILGISIFVEYPTVVFFVPLILLYIYRHLIIIQYIKREIIKIKLKPSIFLGIVGLVIALIPTFIYNQKAYGNPYQLAGTLESVRELTPNKFGEITVPIKEAGEVSATGFFQLKNLPNSLQVLFVSYDRGILFFAPVMLLFFFGIRPLYKRNKEICLTVLGVIISVFILYGMWGDPWGGWAFGTRYLIPAFAFMSIFLALAIGKYGKKIWFLFPFFVLSAYSIFVNLSGALTTNQIPPSIEADSLKYPKFTFLYNFNLIREGKTGSFIYNEFVKNSLDLTKYAALIYILVFSTIVFFYFLSITKKGKKYVKN